MPKNQLTLENIEDVVHVFRGSWDTELMPMFIQHYAMFFDDELKLISCKLLQTSRIGGLLIDGLLLQQLSFITYCRYVIIARNMLPNNKTPNMTDFANCALAKEVLAPIGVDIIDYVLIDKNKYHSFSEEKRFEFI